MKKLLSLILALCMLAACSMPAFAAKGITYRTETKKISDTTNTVSSIKATLTVPNYIGSVKATLDTSEGSGDFDVAVVYVPNSKWDGDCYYSGVTANIKNGKNTIYPAYEDVVMWNEYYNYGFLPMNGGIYILDSTSLQMNFLSGPGLYTALASFYYSPQSYGADSAEALAAKYGYSSPEEMASARPDMLSMSAIGFPFILILDDDMIDTFLDTGKLDSLSKYEWPGLEDLLLEHRYDPSAVAAEQGFANFTNRKKYFKGVFLDVGFDAASWYDTYAETTYKLGLMQGMDGRFNAGGNLTIAQAITMACRVHNIYSGGNGDFIQSPDLWYKVYINYAIENGIITRYDFNAHRDSSVYDRTCTRAEMAYIFAGALPDNALEVKNVITHIPDVSISTPYRNQIFTLYQAGVLEGSDSAHNFRPSSYITRGEAAAIIARMAVPSMRKRFTIE